MANIIHSLANRMRRGYELLRPDQRAVLIEQPRGRMTDWFRACVRVAQRDAAPLDADDLGDWTSVAFYFPADLPCWDGSPRTGVEIDTCGGRHDTIVAGLANCGTFEDHHPGWGHNLRYQVFQPRRPGQFMLIAFHWGNRHASVRQLRRLTRGEDPDAYDE